MLNSLENLTDRSLRSISRLLPGLQAMVVPRLLSAEKSAESAESAAIFGLASTRARLPAHSCVPLVEAGLSPCALVVRYALLISAINEEKECFSSQIFCILE